MTDEITKDLIVLDEKFDNYEILYRNLFELQTQRYLIDNCILFSPPESIPIPENFKILYKSLYHYKSFEKNQHFYENILQAMEYVTKVKFKRKKFKKIILRKI